MSLPETKWSLVATTSITFDANKLENAPIGQPEMLPNFISFNQGVNSLITDVNYITTYKDFWCFFRCLSLFCGFSLNNLENEIQTKFRLYCEHRQINPSSFQGVSLSNFIILEDLFETNAMVYELVERENEAVCRLILNSRKIFSKTIKLNIFKNHFSCIFNFKKYFSVFHCRKCDALWYHQSNYNQHLKHCNSEVKYKYKEGVFRLTPTLFEELAELCYLRA